MDRVLSGCSQEARARSSPRGPPTAPAALRPSSPPPQRPARWRLATFRLTLRELTLRRSRCALERRHASERRALLAASTTERERLRHRSAACPKPPTAAAFGRLCSICTQSRRCSTRSSVFGSSPARRTASTGTCSRPASERKECGCGGLCFGLIYGFCWISTDAKSARCRCPRGAKPPATWSRRSRTLCHRCWSSPRVAATAAAPSGDRMVCTSPPIRFTTFMAGDTHRAGCTCMESP